jgi:hypothetical protein
MLVVLNTSISDDTVEITGVRGRRRPRRDVHYFYDELPMA